MRVLFLPRYDSDGASSRYRFFQFIPWLTAQGIGCDCQPFLAQGYVHKRFAGKYGFLRMLPAAYGRRLKALRSASRYDLTVVEKEAFPFLPLNPEVGVWPSSARYVVDYDDAIFHRYDSHSNPAVRFFLRDKIAGVMAHASGVIAGSEYVYQYARQHNANTCFIPTVIDLGNYPSEPPALAPDGPFVIGWIGSQGSIGYLRGVEAALDEFCATHNARVLIIGGQQIPLKIRSLQWIPWSEESEVAWLSQIDVGIMPLPGGPWDLGKCAFKLIQYMGCWKPVIASPVGENTRVVEDGVNGFLAATDSDWLRTLHILYKDRRLCRKMGEAGRQKVETTYCLSVAAPLLVRALQNTVSRKQDVIPVK